MITASMAFIINKNVLNHTIYTKELLEKGALLTQDKDKSVLTLMKLENVIEQNFVILQHQIIPFQYCVAETLDKDATLAASNINACKVRRKLSLHLLVNFTS